MITDKFFADNKKVWEGYLAHPFIQDMICGKLDISKFRYYMIQDYKYLLEYTKVFAIGLTKARDIEDLSYLSELVSGISWEITNVHLGYMKEIGISDEEVIRSESNLNNLGYTSYMKSVAYEGDLMATLVAVLSCSWSYAYIAKNMVELNPKVVEDRFYGKWVRAYISDEYVKGNELLMKMVNEKSDALTKEEVEDLRVIFKNCSEFEMEFWKAAYKGEVNNH